MTAAGASTSPAETPQDRGFAAALAALDAVSADAEATYTLSSGVVLRFRDVPPFALRRAVQGLGDAPAPPMAPGPRGGELEENPADPAYAEAVEAHQEAIYLAGLNVALSLGTVIDTLPEGFAGPDSDTWIEELEAAGISCASAGRSLPARYLEWLHLYAFRQPRDIAVVTARAMMRAGLLEAEIAETIATFLRIAERRADRAGSPS